MLKNWRSNFTWHILLALVLCGAIPYAASQAPEAQRPPQQMPGPGGPGGPGGRGGPGGQGGGRGFAYGASGPQAQFQQHCAACHTAQGLEIGGRVTPSESALKAMSQEKLYEAITTGKMVAQAASMDDKAKRELVGYLTGHAFTDARGLGVAAMTNQCTSNPPLGQLSASPSWAGWSPTANNSRFEPAAAARLAAADVPKLKLKWAFGLPGTGIMVSQPTVAFGRVFVAGDNKMIYSANAKTGCAYWAFEADENGRFAPTIGPISGHPGSTYAVYFVTGSGTTYAIDAHNGKLLWKTDVKGLHHVSNSLSYSNGRVYVPLAGTETMAPMMNREVECCKSRGGLAAIDANTGKLLWKVDTIAQPPQRVGTTPGGKAIWGFSGASVWNVPTVDEKRKRIYVGTGNSYGPVAADTSDSILAFSIDDGHLIWKHQEFEGDAFMVGCGPTNAAGGVCPEKLGPDWDFGGSSAILQTLPDGRDVLVAAGKGGVAIALDPETGKRLWRTQLWEGTPPSAMGLILFGGTADGHRAYYPLQQPGGGLVALQLGTGAVDWRAAINADRRGQSSAASSIPGVVFTGGWDGILRAVDDRGKVIWTFDTARSFDTINGVSGKGGSLGVTGPTIVDGMVYVGSGYVGVQQGTSGNVLLAFAVE